ncbi:MAG: hypothetical protein QNK23_02720 [Crocinitomicaceae bacterium]|nr:hypothetical protein [Crocinitomicaceae bacterium]
MTKFLTVAVLFVLLVSCGGGPQKVGTNTVDEHMDYIVQQIDRCEHMYSQHFDMLESTGYSMMEDLMIKTYKEALENIKGLNDFDDPTEFEPNKLSELKDAGLVIIETYISIWENELTKIDDEDVRYESDKWKAIMRIADTKIENAYDAFDKKQEELAAEYGITLY